MEYTHLGRSGLSVSRLCLGTMNFGPETSEEDSHAIMNRALDEGMNFFDTANTYGWRKGEGWTEHASERVQDRLREVRDQVERYEAFCAEQLGEEPAKVALAWLLHQPAVTSPITGPRTMDHLEGSLRALDIALDEKALATLDEIFPGPGGPAPEAYAW